MRTEADCRNYLERITELQNEMKTDVGDNKR